MSKPIELFLQATLHQADDGYTIQLDHRVDCPQRGYYCITTISSFTPDLLIRVYWHNLPHNSVRLIAQFRPDIEAYVKTIIAANTTLRNIVEMQIDGRQWRL